MNCCDIAEAHVPGRASAERADTEETGDSKSVPIHLTGLHLP